MDKERIENALDAILETLACIEHERWAHWQRYMHGKGTLQPDGSILIPAELASRWATQMNKPYSSLTNLEKESDREQVRKYLIHIKTALITLDDGPRGP